MHCTILQPCFQPYLALPSNKTEMLVRRLKHAHRELLKKLYLQVLTMGANNIIWISVQKSKESSSTNVIFNLKQLLYPNLYPNYFGAIIRSCPGELN